MKVIRSKKKYKKDLILYKVLKGYSFWIHICQLLTYLRNYFFIVFAIYFVDRKYGLVYGA